MMSASPALPLFVLVGPTASGKSGAAVPVARALDAEIISLDSMALYRGMDIGTDKPRDLGGVRHHLLDLLEPTERFDLARFLAAADAAITGIRERNHRVLVVGGTGLYLMGLLKGVFGGAPRDPAFRATLSGVSGDTLHARLLEIDEATAARVHKNDRRRIVRALEVHAVTGKPLSELQTQFEGEDRYASVVAGVRRTRDDLRRRARLRIDQMWAEGLVEEVRGLELGDTAGQAVGYKEVAGFLSGEYDEEEAKRLVLRNTMRLVRRQGTWFKRFDVTWVDASPTDDAGTLCPKLLEIYRGATTP